MNNLLWVFAPNYGSNVTKYYPGADFTDIVGLDAYFDKPKTLNITGYAEMAALGKPFGLTEFGGVPAAGGSNHVFDNQVIIKEIKAKYPKLSFFMTWHCPWSLYCQDNAGGLLNDAWVLTRDELNWKSMPLVTGVRTDRSRDKASLIPYRSESREGYSVRGRKGERKMASPRFSRPEP